MASVATDELFASLDTRTRRLLDLRRGSATGGRRGWLVRRALVGADLAGLVLAFVVAQEVYVARTTHAGALDGVSEVVAFVLSLPAWIVAARVYGLYDKDEERTDHSTTDDLTRVFHLVTVCTFVLYAVARETGWITPEFAKLLLFWVLAVACMTVGRSVARAYCRRRVEYLQNTIILGAGDVGQSLARKLLKHPEYGLNLVGFVDSNPRDLAADLEHLSLLRDEEGLAELIDLLDIERVILAFSGDTHMELLEMIRRLGDLEVQMDIVPRLFDALGPSMSIHTLEGVPLLSLPPRRLTPSALFLKRATDLLIASLTLIVAAPVMAAVAVIVKLDSPGPILYRSARIGRHGRTFHALKFRTMKAEGEDGSSNGLSALLEDATLRDEFERTHKLENDPRITNAGRWLRRMSLDELPQVWNILRGDISVVGPRPITVQEYEILGDQALWSAGYWTASALRPGLTGYWQINGRSAMDYSDRVRLDLAYVNSWSLALDLEILAKTLRVLLRQQGAY